MGKKRNKEESRREYEARCERTASRILDAHIMRAIRELNVNYEHEEMVRERVNLFMKANNMSIEEVYWIVRMVLELGVSASADKILSQAESPPIVQVAPSDIEVSNSTNKSPRNTKSQEASQEARASSPPVTGERLLLLILKKEERVNIPGDLEEEFKQITAKHGARFAKLWYYKQVAASAWPMIRKTVSVGLLAWVEEWIRKRV